MKHRVLLVVRTIAIPLGFVLWVIIGPIVSWLSGTKSHYVPWWEWILFGRTQTGTTATYWVGVAISVGGLIILLVGVLDIIMAIVKS